MKLYFKSFIACKRLFQCVRLTIACILGPWVKFWPLTQIYCGGFKKLDDLSSSRVDVFSELCAFCDLNCFCILLSFI